MADKLGPRVTVSVGKDKNGKAVYSYMLKKHADYFKFPGVQKQIVTRKGKKGRTATIRGAVGQGHIKVPTNKKNRDGTTKYYQIPMPGSMTIAKIENFLKAAGSNKPKSFVSQDGVSYPVYSK